MSYRDRFSKDPSICNGETVIKGTRVPVRVILSHLAGEDSIEEILTNYPSISADDVKAVIAFAAASAAEDEPSSTLDPSRLV